MILDTSFIIDLMRNDQESIKKIAGLKKTSTNLMSTTLSVFEIWQGIEDLESEEKKDKIVKFLSSIGFLTLDVASAKKAGTIYTKLRRNGIDIGAVDSLIGAIALLHNQTILTRNVKHFNRIEDLKVESY
ncbi:PIN domain-containing protein [Candidatus Woesearchaeota archaeon]|nr:PIN domain-containing protein [Candidatus Woesearchaeota archaeon]